MEVITNIKQEFYGDLIFGDTFISNGYVYVKTVQYPACSYNAVCLSDGQMKSFDNTTDVCKVDLVCVERNMVKD